MTPLEHSNIGVNICLYTCWFNILVVIQLVWIILGQVLVLFIHVVQLQFIHFIASLVDRVGSESFVSYTIHFRQLLWIGLLFLG